MAKKHAPGLWNNKWTKVMRVLGFEETKPEPFMYRKGIFWGLPYIDDIILIARSEQMVNEVKRPFHGE